jgi:hypothetical protein
MKPTLTALPALTCAALFASVVLATGDDSARLAALFSQAPAGAVVTVPPGDYSLDGAQPIPLSSGLTVMAYGARFHFPERLGDKARAVMFAGENVHDLRWFGGHFAGRVFDPAKAENSWEPNANTRAILITTTAGGHTENLTFRDVTSDGVAGAVITVLGAAKLGSEREVETFARNVTLENCTLERSGKFMWDYGYLWQITVWPEDHNDAERAMAAKYFRHDLVRGPVRMKAGEDRVFFDNAKPLPVTRKREGAEAERGHDAVCFFGDTLPSNLVRGRQYFVVESTPEFIRIAETAGGAAVKFASDAGPRARLIGNLFQTHLALYAPAGRAKARSIWSAAKTSSCAEAGSAHSATRCTSRNRAAWCSVAITSPDRGWVRSSSLSFAKTRSSPATPWMARTARVSSAWRSRART